MLMKMKSWGKPRHTVFFFVLSEISRASDSALLRVDLSLRNVYKEMGCIRSDHGILHGPA